MTTKEELSRWLDTLNAGAAVWIDDGGLTLQAEGGGAWLEVGGSKKAELVALFEARGFKIQFDMPGEGFVILKPDGDIFESFEDIPEDLRDAARELEALTT